MTSSKNIYQVTDLIEFVNFNLQKVTIYNLTEYFTVFHLICVFDNFFEYATLLFCLLIVPRGIIVLLIFDAVKVKPIPWDS